MRAHCPLHRDQIPRQGAFAESEKALLQSSQARRQEAVLGSPRQLLSGVFILEVGSKRRRALGNDGWKVGVSFKSSLQVLCPSCLFLGHMCKFRVGRSVCYMWWIFSL